MIGIQFNDFISVEQKATFIQKKINIAVFIITHTPFFQETYPEFTQQVRQLLPKLELEECPLNEIQNLFKFLEKKGTIEISKELASKLGKAVFDIFQVFQRGCHHVQFSEALIIRKFLFLMIPFIEKYRIQLEDPALFCAFTNQSGEVTKESLSSLNQQMQDWIHILEEGFHDFVKKSAKELQDCQNFLNSVEKIILNIAKKLEKKETLNEKGILEIQEVALRTIEWRNKSTPTMENQIACEVASIEKQKIDSYASLAQKLQYFDVLAKNSQDDPLLYQKSYKELRQNIKTFSFVFSEEI